VDSPPIEDHQGIAVSALRVADVGVIPVAPTTVEVDRMAPVLHVIAEVNTLRQSDLTTFVLLNRCVANAASTGEAEDELTAQGHHVLTAPYPAPGAVRAVLRRARCGQGHRLRRRRRRDPRLRGASGSGRLRHGLIGVAPVVRALIAELEVNPALNLAVEEAIAKAKPAAAGDLVKTTYDLAPPLYRGLKEWAASHDVPNVAIVRALMTVLIKDRNGAISTLIAAAAQK
jgi:hypothetical protein